MILVNIKCRQQRETYELTIICIIYYTYTDIWKYAYGLSTEVNVTLFNIKINK